jgi:hypothetical protein
MRIKLIAALVLLVPATAAAQRTGDKWFGMTWSMSTATGNSQQFASGYSFRGLGMEWRQFKGPSTSVGLSLAWNLMNEEFLGTSSIRQVDVTGLQFRYINAYSILLAAHKYLGTNQGNARPFIGIKTGTYYINRRVDVGIWTASDNTWHYGLAPEFGIAMPLRHTVDGEAFYAAVRYNYAFASGGTPYQSWVGIDVGIATRRF